MTTVLGIDPGGSETGLVVRQGATLLGHVLVRRAKLAPAQRGIQAYARAVHVAGAGLLADVARGCDVAVLVEGVNPPVGKLGMINVGGLLDTAFVAGHLLGLSWGGLPTWLVPPGGNGSGPLIAYPLALRPLRGQGKGADLLRHCRSAWDVAGTNIRLLAA